jgi:hypothetical protein
MRHICALILAAAVLCSPLNTVTAFQPDQLSRDEHFALVVRLEQKGHVSVGDDRALAFAQAASTLASYIQRWLRDPKATIYLINQYRLAVDTELAGRDFHAAQQYAACLKHPRIDHRDATFDGKPIRALVSERLSSIHARLAVLGAGVRAPSASIEPVLYSIESSKKEGIPTDLRAFSNRPAELGPLQILEIASRSMRHEDLSSARALSEQLLRQRIGGLFDVTSIDGIVVAGIGASAGRVQDFAEQLAQALGRIRTLYGLRPGQRIIYVYSNLSSYDAEGLGSRISTAVHYNAMPSREGYFNPMDNSVVLRKNLSPYGSSGFMLGTAYHELTHAALADDGWQVPRWLSEGLATLLEEQDASGPIDNYRLYYLRASQMLPRMSDVLNDANPAWQDRRQPIFAAYARYLAFYLFTRDPSGSVLRRFYTDARARHLSTASGAVELLEEIEGIPLETLEQRLDEFIKARDTTVVDKKWGLLAKPIDAWVSGVARMAP